MCAVCCNLIDCMHLLWHTGCLGGHWHCVVTLQVGHISCLLISGEKLGLRCFLFPLGIYLLSAFFMSLDCAIVFFSIILVVSVVSLLKVNLDNFQEHLSGRMVVVWNVVCVMWFGVLWLGKESGAKSVHVFLVIMGAKLGVEKVLLGKVSLKLAWCVCVHICVAECVKLMYLCANFFTSV